VALLFGTNIFLEVVTSSNESLKKRVEAVLDMAVTTVSSLTESFTSGVPVPDENARLSRDKGQSDASTEYPISQDSSITKEGKLADEPEHEPDHEGPDATKGKLNADESEDSDLEGVLAVHD
jgi:cleavage and polyadenylation specificity factor subunit 3